MAVQPRFVFYVEFRIHDVGEIMAGNGKTRRPCLRSPGLKREGGPQAFIREIERIVISLLALSVSVASVAPLQMILENGRGSAPSRYVAGQRPSMDSTCGSALFAGVYMARAVAEELASLSRSQRRKSGSAAIDRGLSRQTRALHLVFAGPPCHTM